MQRRFEEKCEQDCLFAVAVARPRRRTDIVLDGEATTRGNAFRERHRRRGYEPAVAGMLGDVQTKVCNRERVCVCRGVKRERMGQKFSDLIWNQSKRQGAALTVQSPLTSPTSSTAFPVSPVTARALECRASDVEAA